MYACTCISPDDYGDEYGCSSDDDCGRHKLWAVAQEYDILLATQLDEQQSYYEAIISRMIADEAQQHAQQVQFTAQEQQQASLAVTR